MFIIVQTQQHNVEKEWTAVINTTII